MAIATDTPTLTDPQVTRQITELLKHRHNTDRGQWAFFTELLRIDFLAFNCWGSGQYRRVAYEVKASRSDFLRELSTPEKRAGAYQVANECFFAMPVGTAAVDEIPERWGLLELTKGGLRQKKAAQYRDVEIPAEFVAALARRVHREQLEKQLDAPALPALFWKYAGEEIAEDQILQLATTNLRYFEQSVRSDAVREYIESEGLEKLYALRRVIERVCGRVIANDPDALEKHLVKGGLIKPTAVKYRLQNIRSSLEYLEDLYGEEEE